VQMLLSFLAFDIAAQPTTPVADRLPKPRRADLSRILNEQIAGTVRNHPHTGTFRSGSPADLRSSVDA
jgi:hypothetical protein